MKLQIIGWFLVGALVIGIGLYIYNDSYPQQKTVQETTQRLSLEKEDNQYEVEIIP